MGDSLDLYSTRPDLYDLMHAEHVEDAHFLHEFAASLGDSPVVLELGCGTGRLLVPLLDAGARVTGLDNNATMLGIARDRLALYADRLTLIEGDMRHFALDQRFDLAVVGLNTFLHLLTIDEQLDCLNCIHQHLRPAGTLLLDLMNPHAILRDSPLGVLQHRFTKSAPLHEGTMIRLWSCTNFSTARQLAHTTLFFDELAEQDGTVRWTTVEVLLRLLYRYELELLLARSGFGVRQLYGNYDGGPFEDESERMICVAAALA